VFPFASDCDLVQVTAELILCREIFLHKQKESDRTTEFVDSTALIFFMLLVIQTLCS
jgi:hypothetical protein